jgi:hypothetical protein
LSKLTQPLLRHVQGDIFGGKLLDEGFDELRHVVVLAVVP